MLFRIGCGGFIFAGLLTFVCCCHWILDCLGSEARAGTSNGKFISCLPTILKSAQYLARLHFAGAGRPVLTQRFEETSPAPCPVRTNVIRAI
jgi:hypothetical protein